MSLLIIPCFFSFFKAINGVRGEVRMEKGPGTGIYKNSWVISMHFNSLPIDCLESPR